jgi:AAA domain
MISTDELDTIINYNDDNRTDTDITSASKELERGLLDYDAAPCNLKIDQTTNKEFKDPNLNYLDSKLMNEMYEMAMYSGDMKFSLQVAEMLYTRTKLSDQEFISPYAAHYFNHRKNMLQTDLVEGVYKSY